MTLLRARPLITKAIRAFSVDITPEDYRTVVAVKELKTFCNTVITTCGAKPQYASQLVDVLLEADIRGHYSHGMNRLRKKIFLMLMIHRNVRVGLAAWHYREKCRTNY